MSDEEEEEESVDDIPYNPKNLSLGWNDKPIPYWLYKLHHSGFEPKLCQNKNKTETVEPSA